MDDKLRDIISGAMLIVAITAGLSFYADFSGNSIGGALEKHVKYLLLLCAFIASAALVIHWISKPRD